MLLHILLAALLMQQPVEQIQVVPEGIQFHIFNPPADIEITLADVIDLLTDYDVVQEDTGLLKYFGYHGVTAPEIRKIFISSAPDMSSRRLVVIHELIHAVLWKYGYDSRGPLWEQFIAQKTNEIYSKIFLAKPKAETKAPVQTPQADPTPIPK